jgi:hypothetical protein
VREHPEVAGVEPAVGVDNRFVRSGRL